MAKVMRLRGPTGKGESGLKGASLDLLVHLPPNQSLPALLHYAFHLRFWHYTVRTGHGTTDWFQIRKGVCQGCILSPCLFNLYAEYIMRDAGLGETQAKIKIAWRNINNLRYTDDTTLMYPYDLIIWFATSYEHPTYLAVSLMASIAETFAILHFLSYPFMFFSFKSTFIMFNKCWNFNVFNTYNI